MADEWEDITPQGAAPAPANADGAGADDEWEDVTPGSPVQQNIRGQAQEQLNQAFPDPRSLSKEQLIQMFPEQAFNIQAGAGPDYTTIARRQRGLGASQAPEAATALIGAAGEAIASRTTAPLRAGIRAAQQGENPFSAAYEQFGKPSETSPSGEQILQAAGVTSQPLKQYIPEGVQKQFPQLYKSGAFETPVSSALGVPTELVLDPLLAAGPVVRGGSKMAEALMASRAGPALEAAAKFPVKAARATAKFGVKKAASIFGGVRGDVVEEYLQHADRINQAKNFSEIKEGIDAFTGKLIDDVEKARITQNDAKIMLGNARKEAQANLGVSKLEAGAELRAAEDRLNQALKAKLESVASVASPSELASTAVDSVKKLKDAVIEGSSRAYQVLDQYSANGATMDTSGLPGLIEKAQAKLKVAGKTPIGRASQSAYGLLEDYKTQLSGLPKEISLTEAKKLIQQLDADIDYINNAGEFSDDASRALIEMRRGVDGYIKNIPEYQEIMAGVSEDSKLLSRVSKAFGDEQKASTALNSISSTQNAPKRAILNELGKRTNIDFETPISKFEKAKTSLKSPVFKETTRRGLPEFAEVEKAKKSLDTIKKRTIGEMVRMEESAVVEANKELDRAQRALKPFERFTPQRSEQSISAFARPGASEELSRAFDELSRMSNTDFAQAVKDYGKKQAFSVGATNGSRNVNLLAAIFGSLAIGLGAGPQVFGAMTGIGAVLGGALDKFGPAITKRALDVIRRADNFSQKALSSVRGVKVDDETLRAAMYLTSHARDSEERENRKKALKEQ